MITDTLQVNLSGTDGTRLTGSYQETGNTQIFSTQNIPASTTNQLVSVAFTVASAYLIVITASQNCTLKTNSTSSPGNTIDLVAGIPLVWDASSGYYANPFTTTSVTAFYVTTTAATQFQCAILTS